MFTYYLSFCLQINSWSAPIRCFHTIVSNSEGLINESLFCCAKSYFKLFNSALLVPPNGKKLLNFEGLINKSLFLPLFALFHTIVSNSEGLINESLFLPLFPVFHTIVSNSEGLINESLFCCAKSCFKLFSSALLIPPIWGNVRYSL